MKKLLLFYVFVISMLSIAYGQPSQTSTGDSLLIISLENDWAKAMIKKDQKVCSQLLASDFFYTENEKMYTRDEVLQSVLSTSETIIKAYNEGMQVHLFDNTGIVTGWLTVVGKGADGGFKRKYRFTDIWFNRNDNWQLIAAQDYLMPLN
jgi:hypothetical protein